MPGQNTTCTFTNTKRGSLTIIKEAQPEGNQEFMFSGNFDDGNFSLIDDGTVSNTKVFSNIEPNKTYNITENNANLGNSWDLDSIECVGASDYENDITERSAHINLQPGEDITCTFTNSKRGIISGMKWNDLNGNASYYDEDEPMLNGWTIFIDENRNGILDGEEISKVTADDNGNPGQYKFEDIKAGTYSVCEVEKPGWTRKYPADSNCQEVVLEKGGSVNDVNFGNVQLSDIHGYKWSDKNGDGVLNADEYLLSGWTIFIDKNDNELLDDGEISMITSPGEHYGWYWFEDLLPGEYKICEVGQDGWAQTFPNDSNCYTVNLPDGNSYGFPISQNYVSGPEYNFGNQQLANVNVTKYDDKNGNGIQDEGEEVMSGWTINLDELSGVTNENGNVFFEDLAPNKEYVLGEEMQEGWKQTNISCEVEEAEQGVLITKQGEAYGHHGMCQGWNGCGNAETCAQWACEINGYDHVISYGDQRPCTQFGMCHLFYERGSIQWNWGNWCDVMGVTEIRCGGGNTTEQDNLNEREDVMISEDEQLPSDGVLNLNVKPGDVWTCSIGNQFVDPKLKVEKFNNATDNKKPGESVGYTIKVSTPSGEDGNLSNVDDVVVTDLPPAGFVYRDGSWKAESNLRGDLGLISGLGLTKIYASPGKWSLGSMQPGEVVELSYEVEINNNQDSGNYKDVVYASGKSILGEDVMANEDEADPYFVGTEVAVISPIVANVEIPEEIETETETKHKTKKVLGATTYLPATGSDTSWLFFAGILFLVGLILVVVSKITKTSLMKSMKIFKIILLIFASTFLLFSAKNGVLADSPDGNIKVKIEQPKTPNGNSFEIGFVALDIKGRDLKAECYKNSDATPFQTFDLISGGTSGNCSVNSDVVATDGFYDFFVKVIADDGGYNYGSSVTVEVIGGSPKTPVKYNRNEKDCFVTFTTADDGGQTTKIALYKSKEVSFIADETTKINEIAIGSNASGTITDPSPSCGKDYFYVIRAFNKADVGSGFIGDEDVKVETETETETDIERINPVVYVSGAVPVENEENVVIDGRTEQPEETITAGENAEQENVSVEGAKESGKNLTSIIKDNWFWIFLGFLVLAITGYVLMIKNFFKKKDVK